MCEKLHYCNICGKVLVTFSSPERHKFIHTGEMTYRCGTSEKAFIILTNLTKHILTHTDEGTYKYVSRRNGTLEYV